MIQQTTRALWLGAGMLSLVATHARAGNIDVDLMTTANSTYSQSQVVQTDQPNVEAVHVSGPGEIVLSISDYNISPLLDNVVFGVTNASGSMLDLTGPRTVTLNVSGPTTLYVDVFAAGNGASGMAVYDLNARFVPASPVPLPPGGALFASALVLMAGWLWRPRLQLGVAH